MSGTRIGKTVLACAAALHAAAFAAGCAALFKEVFKAPKVRVVDVALAGNPFDNPEKPFDLLLTLAVDNPNSFDLRVEDIAYSAVLAAETIASGERRDPMRIAASTVTEVKVPLRVHPDALKRALRQVAAQRAAPYEFNGSIGLQAPVAGVLRVPFSKTGSFDPADLLRKRGFGLN